MAEAFKKLAQGAITNTPSAVYTVPGSTTAVIRHISIVSIGGDETVSLWHDGSADANAILPPQLIPAGGYMEFDGVITMETGDTLVVDGFTGPECTITVHGLEIT